MGTLTKKLDKKSSEIKNGKELSINHPCNLKDISIDFQR